jgi:hypothetical protein
VVDAARLEPCCRSKEESQLTDNDELHVVFGTGPVGMVVMDELVRAGFSPPVFCHGSGCRAHSE